MVYLPLCCCLVWLSLLGGKENLRSHIALLVHSPVVPHTTHGIVAKTPLILGKQN